MENYGDPEILLSGAEPASSHVSSVSGSPPPQLSVVDVYEAASEIGADLEILAEKFGRDSIEKVVPKVCAVLEQLEQFAARSDRDAARLQDQKLEAALEAVEVYRQEKRHIRDRYQHEMEEMETEWKEESERLSSTVDELTSENERLRSALKAEKKPLEPTESASSNGSFPVHKPLSGASTPSSQDGFTSVREALAKHKEDLREKNALLEEAQTELATLRNEVERQRNVVREQKGRHTTLHKQARKLMEEKNLLTNHLRQSMLGNLALEQQLKDAGLPVSSFAQPLRLTSSVSNMANEEITLGGDLDATSKNLPVPQQPLRSVQSQPAGPTPAFELDEGDQPRFTLNELRRMLNERNHLKAKVMELQDEIAMSKRVVSLEPILGGAGILETVPDKDGVARRLSTSIFRRLSSAPPIPDEPEVDQSMASTISEVESGLQDIELSTRSEEPDEAPVQGPINREPRDKLFPGSKRRSKKRDSVIRNLYKGLFGDTFTSIVGDGIFYKFGETNAHLAD